MPEAIAEQLAAAGRELAAAETARHAALAKVADLADEARNTLPITQIANLARVSRPTIYKMLSDRRSASNISA